MAGINFKYGLDELPPPGELLLYGLQWLAITVPTVIIIGKVVAPLHFSLPGDQVAYIGKMFFVTGITLLAQIIWGHRLPVVLGPATVLLVGIAASRGSSVEVIYTSILAGGLVLFALAATGLFGWLKKLFTPRVVAAILILIAFTLAPTIMNLIIAPAGKATSLFNLVFALLFITAAFVAGRLLSGIWKSTLIIWAILAGSLVYFIIYPASLPAPNAAAGLSAWFLGYPGFGPELDPAVLSAFLVCFLALSINDLGSIQSTGDLVRADNLPRRITRGVSLTGLANALSGLLGVIGPVNFSVSPGMIASTGCASRFALIPAALGLVAISLWPGAITFFGSIPSVVVGGILVYIMCSQISAGLLVAFGSGVFKFEDGLVLGLPFMLGIIISFLPAEVVGGFPAPLRPVLGNGFVLGVLSVMFMEHVIYRKIVHR